MTYTLPRPVFEKLAESLKDRDVAEKFASSIEEAVHEIESAAKRETIEKTAMSKAEIKEDLTKVLVTRELFEERFLNMNQVMSERFESMNQVMNERFESMNQLMNERFESMNQLMNERFANVEERFLSMKVYIDERFKRTELWLKIIVGLSLFGMTLANPGFVEIVKSFSR